MSYKNLNGNPEETRFLEAALSKIKRRFQQRNSLPKIKNLSSLLVLKKAASLTLCIAMFRGLIFIKTKKF